METTQTQDNGSQKQSVTIDKQPAKGNDPGGEISLSEDVVATIAGLAARRVDGIHELGKWRMIPFENPSRGVAVEVGKKQAAFDLDVVIDYGVDLRETASQLRTLIAAEVDKMARRQVVEVNINVVGLHREDQDQANESPRVV